MWLLITAIVPASRPYRRRNVLPRLNAAKRARQSRVAALGQAPASDSTRLPSLQEPSVGRAGSLHASTLRRSASTPSSTPNCPHTSLPLRTYSSSLRSQGQGTASPAMLMVDRRRALHARAQAPRRVARLRRRMTAHLSEGTSDRRCTRRYWAADPCAMALMTRRRCKCS